MPGCLMTMARLNRPAVFVYGGTILPGCYQGKNRDIISIFEAVGEYATPACRNALRRAGTALAVGLHFS